MSFVRACRLDELPPDEALAVTISGVEVAVAAQGDDVFAVQDLCTHASVALSEGEVADCQIECWLHGSSFDLRTGKPTTLPAFEPVATFPTQVRAGEVYVDVTTTLNGVTPS
jgi:3-phenylpropionate/trans-cinnamate dioxygenase ferredoxin component